MTNSVYTTIARQTGLLAEMQSVANNIANISTTGFRREGLVFAEHINALEGSEGSLSIPVPNGVATFDSKGAYRQTGGDFDLAFRSGNTLIPRSPNGQQLTRAGSFVPSADGTLVSQDGFPVLDAGGSPVFVPTDLGAIAISPDGTISAGGDPVGQIGLFEPTDPLEMRRVDGVRFTSESGVTPVLDGRVMQGFVEGANVDPVAEVARMIEVQRAYELGQTFLEQEDKRIGSVISTIGGS